MPRHESQYLGLKRVFCVTQNFISKQTAPVTAGTGVACFEDFESLVIVVVSDSVVSLRLPSVSKTKNCKN